MSKRAAKAARAAFPYYPSELNTFDHKTIIVDGNRESRRIYLQGYEQAEKDLVLTWEDIREIGDLISVCFTNCKEGDTSKEIYEEALRRFNELKNKN